MNSPLLSPEDVADLGMTLRDAGYGVGPDHCIAAQRLLVTLAAEGSRFSDRRGLQTLLAPVFCSSPTEQEDFAGHYEQWLARHGELAVHPERADKAVPVATASTRAQTTHFRRGIAALILVSGSIGMLLVANQITRELRGRTASGGVTDYYGKPVSELTMGFRGTPLRAGQDGRFTFSFRLLDLPAKLTAHDQFGFEDSLEINAENYQVPIALHVGPQPPQPTSTATSFRRLELTADEIDFLRKTPYAQSPAQQQPTPTALQLFYRRHFWQLFAAAVSIPLLFMLLWILWKYLPRLQLIRWKSQDEIQLDALRVKGSNTEFFNSPGFRKIAQQLRRHRSVESNDLDPDGTVMESANRGGWFTPVYLWRKRLPDYLILIDRAGFRDFQGRLVDTLVDNLRLGKVEIDCYDFYADPRSLHQSVRRDSFTAKQHTPTGPSVVARTSHAPAGSVLTDERGPAAQLPSRRFTLEDLLAKHPSHNVLIFSDAFGFFSPLSGKLHAWVDGLAQWAFRALIVPEQMLARPDGRTQDLEDAGFLLLPATEKGLAAAVEVLDGVGAERADLVGLDRDGGGAYPDLMLGDDLRWLSEVAPRPSQVSLLIGQLRAYLGRETFSWLCACAVYPELLWDLTLYLGHDLQLLGKDEQRLRLLLRLPWFRYGNIPNWLRQTLTDVMPSEDREAVRAALWSLLGTALQRPLRGFDLSYAKDEEKTATSPRKAAWLRRLLLNFIQTEPAGSALRDYVFLSVLRGRKPQKGLLVPEALRRLWGRFGQPRRPVFQVAAGLLATVAVSAAMYHYRPTPAPPPAAMLPNGAYALPKPTGPAPYHLSLNQIVGDTRIKDAESASALVFQVTGDTGGVKNATPQKLVANAMQSQFAPGNSNSNPVFLYLLGDLIYYNGEAANYSAQFYEPYRNYHAPIYAIPGNHDGDPLAGSQSLDAFTRNFCATSVYYTPEAGGASRATMRQPNPYWTLDTPFATIIGLYTNVPNAGFVDESQQAWLISELRNAPPNKALIVAMHHPVYSVANPSGDGAYLAGVLDHAMAVAGRAPDLVLAAHVNNYQRFTRVLPGRGRAIPYVVAGGGGYFNLRRLPPSTMGSMKVNSDVTLNAYEDKRHGFLRFTSTGTSLRGEYFAVDESGGTGSSPTLVDSFTTSLGASTNAQTGKSHPLEGVYRGAALFDANAGGGKDFWHYLRFYRDGTVIEATTSGTPSQIAAWFQPSSPNISSGAYTVTGSSLTFTTSGDSGTKDYQGTIVGNELVLNKRSQTTGRRSPEVFRPVTLNDNTKPAPPTTAIMHREIRGFVRTPDGKPFAGAAVRLVVGAVSTLYRPTGPDGGFAIDVSLIIPGVPVQFEVQGETIESPPDGKTTLPKDSSTPILLVVSPASPAVPGLTAVQRDRLLGPVVPSTSGNYVFNNWNVSAVDNGPQRPTMFTLERATTVTRISDYHWNDKQGAFPGKGTIGLRGSDEKDYGSWPVATSTGQDGAPNVNWECTPDITLPAGSYEVVDPDPATWSHNSESGGAGFSRIDGYAAEGQAASSANRAVTTPSPLPPTGLTASVAGAKSPNAQSAAPTASGATATQAPRPPTGLTANVDGGGSQSGQSANSNLAVASPDGLLRAEALPDGRIMVRDTKNGLERSVFLSSTARPGFPVTVLAWSPDGTKLAASNEGATDIWDMKGRLLFKKPNGSGPPPKALSWSPDGTQLAMLSADGSVQIWNLNRGSDSTVRLNSSGRVDAVTWSRDSKRLESSGNDGLRRIWDPTTGKEMTAGK